MAELVSFSSDRTSFIRGWHSGRLGLLLPALLRRKQTVNPKADADQGALEDLCWSGRAVDDVILGDGSVEVHPFADHQAVAEWQQ
jgi:hypothetical protein